LGLPADVAGRDGANLTLFRLVRLAIFHTPEQGLYLGPPLAAYADEDRSALGLDVEVLNYEQGKPPRLAAPCSTVVADEPMLVDRWEDPRRLLLLRDLLAAAAENRRLRGSSRFARLEAEADGIHWALQEFVRHEAERLQTARLEAVGEFAAGAGHEINNPLAVISGQAQYLLGHAAEWFDAEIEEDATRSLQAIVAQARRIHGILRDLMLFARPAPACASWFDLPTLVGEVAASLNALAVERRVRLELAGLPDRLALWADASKVRLALACLVRNALEAAQPEGWARLSLCEPPGIAGIEVIVEDSGPGPDLSQRHRLFDPFFSGRQAGRGRGLGLPIAWRLARQQGGDVRLEPQRDGIPTRFVLALPRPLAQPEPHDRAAEGPVPNPSHSRNDAA
jgi:signal transduction histidine kinase